MSPLHGLTLGDVLREHRRSRPDAASRRSTATCGSPTPSSTSGSTGSPTPCARTASARGDRILWLGQNSFRVLEMPARGGQARRVVLPGQLAAVGRRDGVRARRPLPRGRASGRTPRSATPCARRGRSRRPARSARWVQHDDGEYEALVAVGLGRRSRSRCGRSRPRPVLLMYTAAFSGRPNAAMLSHTALDRPGADHRPARPRSTAATCT